MSDQWNQACEGDEPDREHASDPGPQPGESPRAAQSYPGAGGLQAEGEPGSYGPPPRTGQAEPVQTGGYAGRSHYGPGQQPAQQGHPMAPGGQSPQQGHPMAPGGQSPQQGQPYGAPPRQGGGFGGGGASAAPGPQQGWGRPPAQGTGGPPPHGGPYGATPGGGFPATSTTSGPTSSQRTSPGGGVDAGEAMAAFTDLGMRRSTTGALAPLFFLALAAYLVLEWVRDLITVFDIDTGQGVWLLFLGPLKILAILAVARLFLELCLNVMRLRKANDGGAASEL